MEKAAPLLFIIDDDLSTLSALERVLQRDFHVQTFSDCKLMFAELEKISPHIVISDALMPEMNGLQVLQTVRQKSPASVRVILSGLVDAEEMAPSINSGLVHRFLVKPWENQFLKIQMQECLELHKTFKRSQSLEGMALTDSVTGLFNHRHFMNQLNTEIERAKRTERPLTLLMIDFDNFKALNDKAGHQIGDLALKELGTILKSKLRTTDLLFRYGGDEFAVLLPTANSQFGFEVAERLRTSLTELPQGLAGNTISIGLASYPLMAGTGEDLIRQADLALLEAKKKGKNQSIIASH